MMTNFLNFLLSVSEANQCFYLGDYLRKNKTKVNISNMPDRLCSLERIVIFEMLSPISLIEEGVGADEVKGRTRKEQSNHLETIMLADTFTSLTLPKSYIHTIQERYTSKKEWPCWKYGRLKAIKNTLPSVHNFDMKWGGTNCCHLLFKGQGTVGEWVGE